MVLRQPPDPVKQFLDTLTSRFDGRPRKYGRHWLSLAKRAGHARGWVQVTCFQRQEEVIKTVKTFLATWPPAGA